METEVRGGRQLVEEPRLQLDLALALIPAWGLTALVYGGSGVRSGQDWDLSTMSKHHHHHHPQRRSNLLLVVRVGRN